MNVDKVRQLLEQMAELASQTPQEFGTRVEYHLTPDICTAVVIDVGHNDEMRSAVILPTTKAL